MAAPGVVHDGHLLSSDLGIWEYVGRFTNVSSIVQIDVLVYFLVIAFDLSQE